MGIVYNPLTSSFDFIREFLTKTGTVLSPIVTGDTLAIYLAGATVSTDGLVLDNTTASTAGATVQYSPRLRLKGSGWDTDGAVSVNSEWTIENKPVSGTAVSSELLISHSLGGAAYTNPVTITSGGAIKCSEVLSGLSVTYGDLIFGTETTPTVVSRNTADAYDAFTVNNLNAGSTGKLINLQWQSIDRAWLTKEGFLKIESAMNLGTTSTDGLVLANTSPALVGTTVQYSPRLRLRGTAWDTDDAVSRTTDWIIENVPISGNTVSSTLYFRHSLDGGAYTYPFTLTSGGLLTLSDGIITGGSIRAGNATAIQNASSSSIFSLNVGSATSYAVWSRNTADAYAAAVINNLNASSTGHILDCQWQSSNRFIVYKEGGIQSNYNSAISMGGAPDNSAVLTVGWNNSTMAAGTTAARHLIIGGNITELANATITDIVGLYLNTFTIGDGGGTKTLGFASTVYIAGAPTVGTTPAKGPYSLFIDSGEFRLDGNLGDATDRVPTGYFTDLTTTSITATSSISTTQYFGDATSDGSWKMEIESGDLVIYKKETGSWVEKGRYE
jgi:hypothetical protein